MTETYPITEGPEYVKEESPLVSPIKPSLNSSKKKKSEKRGSPSSRSANDSIISMANLYGPLDVEDRSPRVSYVAEFMNNSPLPSPISIDSKAFPFQSQAHPPPKKAEAKEQTQSILKSLLPTQPTQQRHGLEQPLDLGRSQSGKVNGSTSGVNGHGKMSSRGDGEQHGDVQKLRVKNKKYVGMIMQLVHQLFSLGQVPFVDLTSIDQEDRVSI